MEQLLSQRLRCLCANRRPSTAPHQRHSTLDHFLGMMSRLHACGGSDVWLPEGGRLTLYSPAATHNLTRCAHSCFSVAGADVREGALTTPMLEGGLQVFSLTPTPHTLAHRGCVLLTC